MCKQVGGVPVDGNASSLFQLICRPSSAKQPNGAHASFARGLGIVRRIAHHHYPLGAWAAQAFQGRLKDIRMACDFDNAVWPT